MKYSIILMLSLFMGYGDVKADNPDCNGHTFCEGFRTGYPEGYCYQVVGCIKPVIPVCPIPEPGQDSWKDGYNTGVAHGLRDQEWKKYGV